MRLSTAFVLTTALLSGSLHYATASQGFSNVVPTLEKIRNDREAPKKILAEEEYEEGKNLHFIADVVAPVHALAMTGRKKNAPIATSSVRGGSAKFDLEDYATTKKTASRTSNTPASVRVSHKPNNAMKTLGEYYSQKETRKDTPPAQDVARNDLHFTADVVAPVQVVAMANRKNPNGPHRSLQTGAPQCFVLDDGSIACALENFPANGLLTLLFDCVEGVSVFQCDRCVVVLADDLDSLVSGLPTCDGCLTCGDNLSYDCSNFAPEEPCAAADCNGNCVNGGGNPPPGPPGTPPPGTDPPGTQPPGTDPPGTQPPGTDPPSQGAPECFVLEDDSIACVLDDFPADGLLTVLFDCIDGVSVFQCDTCTVVMTENLESLDVTDPQCDRCATCGDSMSYDCANLSPTEPCATRECDGDCTNGGTDPPTTTDCEDTTEFVYVDEEAGDQDCAWLSDNLGRYGYLCQFVDVASACPGTCEHCDLFG